MSNFNKTLDKVENLFLKYGFKSLTMNDISRELGISKKTLYQYVENKNDLINKVIQFHIIQEKEMVQAAKEEARDALHEMLLVSKNIKQSIKKVNSNLIFDLQKYYRESWEMIDNYRKDYVFKTIKDNIAQGIEEGVYRKEINPDTIAKMYIGMMHLIFDEQYFPGGEYNLAKVYTEAIHYHINGIASPKGLKLLENYYQEQKNERG